MKETLRNCVIGSIIVISFASSSYAGMILSADGTETLGSLAFENGSLVDYEFPPVDLSSLFFDENLFTGIADIDAFHLLSDGDLVLSTTMNAELGGLVFRDGDLIKYDPTVNIATMFMSEDLFSDNENIDAVSILSNGHIVLSTYSDAQIGGCLINKGDLVDYDPVNDTAILLLDKDLHFTNPFPDIDAVSVLDNGHILLSTSSNAEIGGLTVRNGDVIDYDPVNATATLFFSKDWFVNPDGFTNVDAVYYVPEPATVLLLGLGSVALVARRRVQR